MPEISAADTTPIFAAALIAGGRSTRMGRDKAWLEWQNRPLWEIQLAKLQSLGAARILVSCREDQGLAGGGGEFIFDSPGEALGPIGAITRCLERVAMPLLVLAVDMPWMPVDFLQREIIARQAAGKGLFHHQCRRYEPLAGIYTPAMLSLLRPAIAADQLGLQPIIASAAASGLIDSIEMRAADAVFFRNANTPQDWSG